LAGFSFAGSREALAAVLTVAANRDLPKGQTGGNQNQIVRLDQVFKKFGQEPEGVQCSAIDGLIEETDEVAGEVADREVLDAAIIGLARAVEHYEIATMVRSSPGQAAAALQELSLHGAADGDQ
jgi:ferritin-like metal-binding protein YciE